MENFSHIPEEIHVLIVDFLIGTIDNKGLYMLNHWIEENDEHLDQFNSLKSTWILSHKPVIQIKEYKSALEKVKRSLETENSKNLVPFWPFSRIAASWLFAIIMVGVLSSYITTRILNNKENQFETTVTAPLGSKSLIDLPDGTKVWLNAGSKLTYNNKYGKSTREVQLTGEAYFAVKTNKKVPFLVRTSDVVVKALGTRFNVKAYPEEKTITTTLEEGKIVVSRVNQKASEKIIEVKPNGMVTYYKQGYKTEPPVRETLPSGIPKNVEEKKPVIEVNPDVKTELFTSWKDETWIIEAQTFGELAPLLERRFNTAIEFGSDQIKKYKFTGKIQRETIEQVMDALGYSAPINYKMTKDKIILSLDKKKLEEYNLFTN
jgi:transmembrane sensor